MPGVRAVRPARGHVVGQQLRCGVGSLFAFAEDDRGLCTLRQFIQAQQGTRLNQTLPAPLLRLTVGPLAPGQRCKHLARFTVFIRAQIEAIERHDRFALGVAIHPDFGRCAVLPVFGWALAHGLGWDRLNGQPFRSIAFAGTWFRFSRPSGNAQ
ncbi:hypothetical protein D3C84_966610 [compost metagenome]